MRRKWRRRCLLFCAAWVAACGLKGNPPNPRAPAAVADLRVEGRDGAVRIGWKGATLAGRERIRSFDVLRRAEEPGVETIFERVGSVKPSGVKRYSFVDDGERKPGIIYWYRVRPRVGGDLIPENLRYVGPEDSITWLAPLPAPAGLTLTPLRGSARIQWQPVEGASGYRVYRLDTAGNALAEPANRGLLDHTEWVAVALEDGKKACFVVRAVSGLDQAKLAIPPPHPGADLPDDPDAPSGAELDAAAGQGIPIPRENIPASFRRATQELLGEGALPGVESHSSDASCVTPGVTAPPPAPRLPKVAPIAEGISFTWRPSPGEEVVGYYVERRDVVDGKPSGEWTRLNTEPVTGSGYVDHDVKPGMSYQYQVRAVDASGTLGKATSPKDATYNP
jgi:hypothetical protein